MNQKASETISKIHTYHMLNFSKVRNWVSYFLSVQRPNPFGMQLLNALAFCEDKVIGLGVKLLKELNEVKYINTSPTIREKQFEQFIQKLAEIMVIRNLLKINWGNNVIFSHEPTAPNGKKPEFMIETDDKVYLVEVKCPSLIQHQFARSKCNIQLPTRAMPRQAAEGDTRDVQNIGTVLPRDNPLKDFLISSEEKFSSFILNKERIGILVIVWDEYMYEAISPLKHDICGLLTENSWYRNPDGDAIKFLNIQYVLILNHFNELVFATREEREKQLRKDPFIIENENYTSNIWCEAECSLQLPNFISSAFDAYHYTAFRGVADYDITDQIIWI